MSPIWCISSASKQSSLFYGFGKLNGKSTCYHLESAQLARDENQVEEIIFSDDEFSDFLSGLISDL